MLNHLNMESLVIPAASFFRGSMSDELVLNPPYQRESVWDAGQRVNLIKSLLQGLPVGAVFLNERVRAPGDADDFHYYVVDGKQRIETLRAFESDCFGVPGEWVEGTAPTADFAFYSELVPRVRRRLDDAPISTYRTKLPTVAAEEDLYNRINFGGTPHLGDVDGRALHVVTNALIERGWSVVGVDPLHLLSPDGRRVELSVRSATA